MNIREGRNAQPVTLLKNLSAVSTLVSSRDATTVCIRITTVRVGKQA